jgi:hypothetical protein
VSKPKARLAMIFACAGVALLGVLLFLAQQRQQAPPPPAQKWLEFEPDAAQKKKLAELLAMLAPGATRFPNEARRDFENAKLFMYMAGTSEQGPVVLASLDAIRYGYSPRGSKKAKPDRDLEKVLVKRLHSPEPAQVQAAFTAAPVALMAQQPEGELLETLLELVRSDSPALRWAALESLDLLPPDSRPVAVLEAILRATEDTPAFAVRALRALRQSRPTLNGQPELKERARARAWLLSSHDDPGLRGSALQALVDLDPNSPGEISDLARKSITDPHPYVRGMAAAGLSVGTLGRESDVHLLMPLTNDFAEAVATLTGPVALDGKAVELLLNVPGRRLVAESALFSVQRLAMGPPPGTPVPDQSPIAWKEPPVLTIGGRVSGLELVEQNAVKMREWYQSEKKKLPSAP